MKRIALLLIAVMLAASAAGCSAKKEEQPAVSEPQTEAETLIRNISATDGAKETEWVAVDSELSLEDKKAIYATKADFLMFAVAGSTDEDCALLFRVSDGIAKMLREQESLEGLYLKLEGEKIGDVELNETCDELTLQGDYTYTELCKLATKIRGLDR